MVLRNCLVLALIALVSQVIATPHGYGVKGGAGAVAKAEASASAGAYSRLPPIPIPIPSGAGFSGSYSKSSSSSFASSSASASSSSSSFSFSGSGANAVNGFDLSGGCSSGSCGCSTGACQNNGAKDIKTPNNGDQGQYSTVTESDTIINNQGIDCPSGICGNKPNLGCTGTDCPTHDNKDIPSTNCKSGNCGQTNSQNDIYVNIPGRSTKNPEEPLKYDVAGYGQNLPSNGKPSTFEPECNSYDCISPSQNPATDDEKRPSSYDVPIFGTTVPSYFPDKKEPCTSPDCLSNDSLNNNPIKPGYNNNLPVPQSTQECAGGICSSQTAAIPKNNPSLKPFTSPYNVPIYSGCTGTNCGTSSYNTPENCGSLGCDNAAQPHATNSKYPQSYESAGKSTPSQNYFSSTGHPNCKGPNCDTLGYPSTNLNTKLPSSTFKYPGDCGTLGCGLTLQSGVSNNENQESAKGSVDNSLTSVDQSGCNGLGCSTPSLENGGTITKQPYYSSSSDCGSSGCGSSPKTDTSYPHSQPNYQNSGNALDSTKCQGAYCGKPSYTNFGNSNVPSANCGLSGCTPHTSTSNIPSYNQPGYGGVVPPLTPGHASPSPSQGWSTQSTVTPSSGYTSSYSGNSYKPTSPISSPNTELVPPNQNSGVGVNTRPYDGVNPNESTFNGKQNTPGYTSGYGSTTINQNGVTKPHYESTASNPSYFPSAPQYSQNTNIPSTPVNGFDVKPFDSPKSSNNKQLYTGGFGAPKGPIDQSIPVTSTVSPSTQVSISLSNIPSASPYKPTNSGSYNQNPIQSSPAPHVTVPQPSVAKDSKKGVSYTGGFGGPSGFLKPNDYSIPTKLPTPGTGPSIAQPKGYSVPAKPSTPITGPSNDAPCASNNCGSKPSHATSLSSATHSSIANANAHAQAAASAVAYTGGFGGPPGFLKPYDDGKVPSNSNSNGNPSSNLQGAGNLGYSNTNYKNTANGIQENASGNTGAVAQANAVATSSAGIHGLDAGSNDGGVKGCSLGCGAPSGNGADGFDVHNHGIKPGAVASAKSVAGAGSYGAGGSFASSLASAHASAGAATKGGYGRR